MEAIVKNIVGDMIANMENECVKVCQSYGFDVDKERLTQALTDARKFYDEGYRDGKADQRLELMQEAFDMAKSTMAPVVRCENCKYKDTCNRTLELIPRQAQVGYLRAVVHFCEYGERRDGNATG